MGWQSDGHSTFPPSHLSTNGADSFVSGACFMFSPCYLYGHVRHSMIEGKDGYLRVDNEFKLQSDILRNWDYYKVLEVSYDASDETIRTSYLRLALKWHPDKHKGEDSATAKFQEINEAYRVLSDPVKRQDYDTSGCIDVQQYSIIEYLNRFKGLILTCNGLGISSSPQW